jgi:hypothetical protein
MNSRGQAITWDFSKLNLTKYTSQEKDSDLVALITPIFFRMDYPIFNLGDSVSSILPFKSPDGSYSLTGKYTASCISTGTLKLSSETFKNVFCVKVIEDYQINSPTDSFCLAYKNSYNYFFTKEVLKPIMCYSEKLRSTCNHIFSEYYNEISRPALDSLNISSSLSNLITAVNLNCSPNPTSGSTTATYNLPINGQVKLTIESLTYNVSTVIENTSKTSGKYAININLTGLIPGIYYLKLYYQNTVFVKQLIVN